MAGMKSTASRRLQIVKHSLIKNSAHVTGFSCGYKKTIDAIK
jgi:hypothetical protein